MHPRGPDIGEEGLWFGQRLPFSDKRATGVANVGCAASPGGLPPPRLFQAAGCLSVVLLITGRVLPIEIEHCPSSLMH
eukprot:12577175-Alexandrium_andersonii.AAC.1